MSVVVVLEGGETITLDALPLSRTVLVRRVSEYGDALDEVFLEPDEARTFALALLAAADSLN